MTVPRGLHWDEKQLEFLDQTLLPDEARSVRTDDWRDVVAGIRRLAIRGAPAIGVAGACAVALAFRRADTREQFEDALAEIERARPTAVNLAWAVNRMRAVMRAGGDRERFEVELAREATRIAEEDARMCERIAVHGQRLIPENCRALTHCNTGALVTYGIGTATGVLRRAHERAALAHVYACETRPLGQGARLTIWELERLEIPATLLCDSAAGRLMQEGKVDLVIVGADRIAANGDTANKVGTYPLAVLARRHGIPFYVAAPSSSFDPSLGSGDEIPVEQRDPGEVRMYGGVRITVEGAAAYNPAFDITPAELISAFVREDGIHRDPATW
ncbi:MAG: Methylthioribose-1-phosphate isomerase [Calditrichaeota bacterium]|nr:Methylthioribose-1-phosphate isomerase [Calditrichota bacterium]